MSRFIWPERTSQTAFPIERAGFGFIFAGAFVTAVFALLDLTVLSLIGLLFTLFTAFFFRDPDRVIPNKEHAVVSPADGRILLADVIEDHDYYQGKCLKISIFMSVFNVHVNRIPYGGTIKKIEYYPGSFLSANLDKASKDNERNAIYIETDDGVPICTVQIAGLIARRIICKVQEGDRLTKGQRFGLICFGSRLDVYLLPEFVVNVSVGDTVKAGTTILGELK